MDVDPCSAVCSPNFKHVQTLKGHSNAVATVKFSPGAGTLLASASADKTARIWETETGRELLVLQGHTQGLSDVSWSPDGAYLATASDDNTLKLWHAESGRCLKTLTGHTNYVFCCSFSPHGNLLVSSPPLPTSLAFHLHETILLLKCKHLERLIALATAIHAACRFLLLSGHRQSAEVAVTGYKLPLPTIQPLPLASSVRTPPYVPKHTYRQ
ncbi:hypothetical protein HaLaN_32306 [Haematococcus lacustris]|uniref:Uncharacterized protein n=1 Tax=Haematococcus lacustris TaxID=44745 RepID=A0A6A0AMJ1_HAELA|nr:hypothetical protein HaLaN_32306 [Haematococcus lacustris]